MEKLNIFLRQDPFQNKAAAEYEKVDGILALALYAVLMIAYHLSGRFYARTGIYAGIYVNLFLGALALTLAYGRRQTLQSIGLGKQNLKKSVIAGIALGLGVLLINLIPGLLDQRKLHSPGSLAAGFLYYFFVIALTEEIVFRGYIQTRIQGLIKNPVSATLFSALLFLLSHIPYQLAASGKALLPFLSEHLITLGFTFLWHLVFTFLYARYRSLAAPTLFHAFLNWSNYLFR